MSSVRGLRGATQCVRDDPEEVLDATQELMAALLAANDLDPADLISAIFTATTDLTSAFPAAAARRMGLTDVPLLCASEIAVPGALPRVIRVLVHASTDLRRPDVRHVYLRGTHVLRDDLTS